MNTENQNPDEVNEAGNDKDNTISGSSSELQTQKDETSKQAKEQSKSSDPRVDTVVPDNDN